MLDDACTRSGAKAPEQPTPRQRVLAALRHTMPDRVPRDLGGTAASGMSLLAYQRLRTYLKVDEEPRLASERGRIARLPECILERFRIDTRGVFPMGGCDLGKRNSDGSHTDGYGVVRRLANDKSQWYVTQSPLSGPISRHDVKAAARRWIGPVDNVRFERFRDELDSLYQSSDCAVVVNLPLGPIQTVHAIRGFSDWLVDTATDPGLAGYLLSTFLDIWLETVERILRTAGSNVDVLFYADDVAIHTGPMISPSAYRRILRPIQERVIQGLRKWSEAKVLYHCCGSILWLLDDLVDLGVDAVNPMQVNAAGMDDTASIKRRFGSRITFWGAVDTSEILPRGDPVAVRSEVNRRVTDLGVAGGYVLAAVHNILGDVPPENVCAMWDA